MNDKEKAIYLLHNAPKWCTYKLIEEKTGIPVGWVTRLKRGKIKQPNATRLQTLLKFFHDNGEYNVQNKYCKH